MKKSSIAILSIVILIIIVLIIVFIPKEQEKTKLKVGAILPLSGSDAYFGESLRKGLVLANKDNSIELIIEDYGSDNKKAVIAASKLINTNDIDVLLTTISEDTLSSIELIKSNKIPTICLACGSVGITKESEYLFRVWPSDELEVKSLIDYAKSKGYEKVSVLHTLSVWENSLTDVFKLNWEENKISIESANRNDQDFRTQLLKIKEFDPDFIYLAIYEQRYPIVMKQLREVNIDADIGTTSWINDPSLLEACSDNCNGLIVPQYSSPSEEFVSEFMKKYNEESGLGADVAYDAIKIIKEIGKKSREEILKDLFEVDYKGASGEIQFDETGDRIRREINLFKIKDKKLEYVTS